MKIERTKNAKRNIIFGFIQKMYQLFIPFLIRTAMIHFMGVKYIGLGSLFTSILQVLNLTELGVGSALVFSMYKPIAEDDTDKICALMQLYKIYYRVIGSVILVLGILITPLIPKLVTGSLPDGIDLYVLYYLNLAATVLSYFLFAYKNSLLSAHQRIDISSKVSLVMSTIQYMLQFVAIYIGNYYLYVIISLFTTALTNIVTSVIVSKVYPKYTACGKLPKEEVKAINKKIADLFTSKIGSVVVDSADTIVISMFLGLEVLAIYNNYFFIMTAIIGFIAIIFNSCTAGIGNSLIVESTEKNYKDLKKYLLIISWIVGVCTNCLLCLYQPFMEIWVGKDLMLSMNMVICICCYFFIHQINRLINNYKDAAGMWHEDRFRPLVTALTNLILNIVLVQYIGLFGILLSTVISMLLVGMPWLLYNLFTVIFKRSAAEFIFKVVKYAVITALGCVISYEICLAINLGHIVGLLVKAIVAFVIPNIIFLLALHKTKEFGEVKEMVRRMIRL